MSYKEIKENIQFKRTKHQQQIHAFLKSRWAHLIVSFCIILSIASVILSFFSVFSSYRNGLFAITYLTSFIFFFEYNLRIYASPSAHPERNAAVARLRYIFSFYGFVDFVAMLPFLLTYLYKDTETSPIIILPYVFIFFKLLRYSRSFRLIGQTLLAVKEELAIAYTSCGIVVCFSAIVMYFLERNAQPEVFRNIGDGLWWAIISFTTVGCGDIYPVTPLGKLLGCVICLIGIAMIAIPTAIISSASSTSCRRRWKTRKNLKKQTFKQSKY